MAWGTLYEDGTDFLKSTIDDPNLTKSRNMKNMMATRNDKRLKTNDLEFYKIDYNYSIVGIDATKVWPTRQKINEYVKRLEEKVKSINESADMNKVVKSEEIQLAVKNYISKVEEYCANLCSMLKIFDYKLYDVQEIWKNTASSFAANITDDTNTIDTSTRLD